MSIRLKITLIIVLSLLFFSLIFLIYAISSNRDSRQSHMNNIINSLMFESETVNKTVRGLEQNAIDLAQAGRAFYLARDKADNKLGAHIVLDNFANMTDTVGGGIWFERFAFRNNKERFCYYACYDKKGILTVQENFDSKEYDYPTQSWYTQIGAELKNGKKIGWSETYTDDLGTRALMVTIGGAILDANGKFVGMSTVDWEIQQVIDQLSAIRPTENSFIILVDPRNNKIVADTNKLKIVIGVKAYYNLKGNKRTSGDNSNDNIGAKNKLDYSSTDYSSTDYSSTDYSSTDNKTIENTPVNNSLNNTLATLNKLAWIEKIPKLNRNYMTVGTLTIDDNSYYSFGRELDNGMQFLVQIPQKELNAELEHRNRVLLIGSCILTILILIFALLFLTFRVNRPLKHLMAGVQELGHGKFDFEFKVQGNDELALLASTFNSMTANLKEHVEHLKLVSAAKEKIESELKVAQEIQCGILPKIQYPFPKCDYFEINAFLMPARDVGGDLYDFFQLAPTKIGLVIGDVSGKGVPASLFMAVTQTLHRGIAHNANIAPNEIANSMNNALCNNNNAGLFVTYMFAIFNTDSGKLDYCNAGHNPFFLLKNNGSVLLCTERHGVPFGLFPDYNYRRGELTLNIGDSLFFYTDGISEAKNAEGEFFGMERLTELLQSIANKKLPPEGINEEVRKGVADFVGSADQFDDITCMTLRFNQLYKNKNGTNLKTEPAGKGN